MKTSSFKILFFVLLFCSMSWAGTVKNVLIGPGIFPTKPNEFILCLVNSSLEGSNLQFLGLGKVSLLPSNNSQIAIQFLAKDSNDKSGFFTIIAHSMDPQMGWQIISADVNGNTFYFSKSVSSVATIMADGGTEAVVFDFLRCQN